jgi:hypothetical protein
MALRRVQPGTLRPGHQLCLHLTGGRHSGRRLLGAQLVGHKDAEVVKRIDTPAGALFQHMTVDGLRDLDLSYTPPFGSTWDAIQPAAHDWPRHSTQDRKLLADLERELAAASVDRPLLLMLFDLNGFKAYNDTFGPTRPSPPPRRP